MGESRVHGRQEVRVTGSRESEYAAHVDSIHSGSEGEVEEIAILLNSGGIIHYAVTEFRGLLRYDTVFRIIHPDAFLKGLAKRFRFLKWKIPAH